MPPIVAVIALLPAGAFYRRCALASAFVAIGFLASANLPAQAADTEASPGFGLPVICKLGVDCFVQQMPDIDASDQVLDPLCGKATYEGHDGWDIRVRSLRDIDRSVPVIAVADGTVLRTRDGMQDRIYDRSHDDELSAGKECGNGILLQHAGGLVSQYCHLKEGSLVVHPGAQVKKGDALGAIGSSGLAEFPHVHLSVKSDGKRIEPLTGRLLGAGPGSCGDTTASLFEPSVTEALSKPALAIMQIGLTNMPPRSATLVREGEPPSPKMSESIFAWVWGINLEPGSLFRIRISDPYGKTILNVETPPLDARKANYVAYAGGMHAKSQGAYDLQIDLISSGKTLRSVRRSIDIGR